MGMLVSRLGKKRGSTLIAVLMLLTTAAPAFAEPGVPPDITAIIDADTDIDPGETRSLLVEVVGLDEGATFSFSGDGVSVTTYRGKNGRYRLTVTAQSDASAGPRDLMATNPDLLAGTYAAALTVTGDLPPPETGDLTGYVFEDLDGNGIEDGLDSGLAGVSVSVVDSVGATHNVTTDGGGSYSVLDLPVGSANVTHSAPSGTALTTANAVQTVTIAVDTSVSTGDVGYQPVATGDITGFVFRDFNGNGIVDGPDNGLQNVDISVIDFGGATYNTTTDAVGNYTVVGLAVGDATVTYTAPSAGFILSTGNDIQTIEVTGGLVSASDVGYDPETGDISGRVFSDVDGNGSEDGDDVGLPSAQITITDSLGVVQVANTDANGDFFVAGVAQGFATVVWTTPDGYSLTTGNDTQVIEVFDQIVSYATDVGFQPPSGIAPEILGVLGNGQIDPGQTKNFRVSVSNYVAGAVFTFSGTGVTAVVIGERSGTARISITADVDAAPGARDMTLTNPDGLAGTLMGAITVTGAP